MRVVQPRRTRGLEPGMAPIALCAAVLLAFQGLHGLDHLTLQDRPLEPQVGGLGVLESTAVVLALLLALRGHPQAPLAAIMAGGFTALAFITVHLLPDWGPLSDPYAEQSLGAASWTVMFAGLAGALALVSAGIAAPRPHTGGRAAHTG